MSQAGDLFRDLQERQMEAMRQYQDTVAETMRAWQGMMPAMPGMPGMPGAGGTDSGSGDSAAAATPPSPGDFASMFPNPAEVADNYFRFAEEMLARQHEFSMRLIETLMPQGGGSGSSGS